MIMERITDFFAHVKDGNILNILILAGIIVVILALTILIVALVSGNKAKKNYKPPVADERIVLSVPPEAALPTTPAGSLRFCPKCGTANSNKNSYCTDCGTKL